MTRRRGRGRSYISLGLAAGCAPATWLAGDDVRLSFFGGGALNSPGID